VTTFGLAALPLFVLGAVGLVIAVRGGRKSRLLRIAYAPAAIYLGAIVAIIAAGGYSGSHRYLYPALPAFALLAAEALDRSAVARLGTAAATAMLAVGFIPVFVGFANDNTGLVAAGAAASGGSGMLVTDSPVAAFYSHRDPSLIVGSQSLPANPDAALSWMGAHDVTELVLEDISYYRATSLFPDLAAGRATPPFQPLGDERAYQVPGGKPAYAYRVGAGLQQQVLFPGVDAAIGLAPTQGKSSPLAKGLTLTVGGESVAGEGVGLGVPIVRYPDGWVYASTVSVVDLSSNGTTVWRCVFQLDEMGGDAVHEYAFVPVASRGSIAVTYTLDAGGVSVVVQPIGLAPGYTEVGILNEESATFDDVANPSTTLTGPRFGRWLAMDGDWARLRSRALGVEWSVPALPGAQLYAGRELSLPGFDWAGLDYMFSGPFAGASYRIQVQQAR
jgi:hypothetical protein